MYSTSEYPEASVKYTICLEGEEDCAHLFFSCSFAKMIWNRQSTLSVDANLETYFWDSIQRGRCRRKEEWGWVLAVLWTIWLYRNDMLFRGRVASMDVVSYAVAGLPAAWSSKPCGKIVNCDFLSFCDRKSPLSG